MTKLNFILGLIVSIFIMGCTKNDKDILDNKKTFPLDNPDLISKQEYEIINQLIDSTLLAQQTNPNLYHDYGPIKNEISELDSLVYVDFLKNNNKGYYLDSNKVCESKIILLSDAEIDYLFNNPDCGWDEFYNWYPNSPGLLSISRAGFNQDSSLAMICIGFEKPLYVSHTVYYLKYEFGKWILIGIMGIHTQ